MALIDNLVYAIKNPKILTPHAVGANWRPISNDPSNIYCGARRPDPAKGAAHLSAHPGVQLMDCTVFVRKVIGWAYGQAGDTMVADKVAKLALGIPQYLANEKHWKGIYWNPDVVRPRDGDIDHVKTYISLKKTGRYQPSGKYKVDVKVDALVVQFYPTLPSTPLHEHPQAKLYRTLLTVNEKLPIPTADPALFQKLMRVRFGVILGKSGDHNALLHLGQVYDANYCVGPDDPRLYGRGPFKEWAHTWSSGIVVVPPGEW